MKFEIICTGWNCAELVDKCIRSVINQELQNFHLHLVNDGSTDTTGEILNKYVGHPKITVYQHKENKGAALRRMEVIRPIEDESICLLLGMDDELLSGCLERIKKEYDDGKWMTYGNWKGQNGLGLPEDFSLEFDEKTHANRDYRKVKYRSTAPNTFKAFLFNAIPDEDFKLNGKWIDTTTESETMFSCLEMCGKERIGVIKEHIYLYNRFRTNGTLKRTYDYNGKKIYGTTYKEIIYQQIIKRPKKELYQPKQALYSIGLIGKTEAVKSKQPFELVVCESGNLINGEPYYKEFLNSNEYCERLIYIHSKKDLSIQEKSDLIQKHISKNSTGYCEFRGVRVLNISSNDWANYSYYNYRSLKAVGVDVEGYKLHPHSFGYDEQHPVITREEMIKKINSGYDIIQIFNSDIMMLHYLTNHKGKVVVYHTGSGYRASHKELNQRFNPVVNKSIIALGEFENLGAKNYTYISVAVDTDKLTARQQSETINKPYKFLHCPSNAKVKGTDKILKMFAKAGMSLIIDTKILSHEESWKRMRNCDIYVELFNPEINGDKYGSFGTTAAEAAALGKVVVTQNLSKEVYKKYYGDCPLILAEDETDFIRKIKWLNALPEKQLLDLQQVHREWAVNKHSFHATGLKLKQALEI